ncbi:fasciclin-3 isoform X2 [Bacillus rossius redtenbacheri]|uniref:fasciclin-3 isoform X2 n=1 Tax=Bacillus rossius redtenbacheri TaxID=93214 RepID=UPI002FDDC5D8
MGVISFALIFFMIGLKGMGLAKTPQIEIIPKYVMVKTGDQVTVLCRAGEPTEYCRITTPFQKVIILAPTRPPKEGYSYAGEGLENGQCGFRIDNVQDQNNGIHGCYMGLSDEASANMTIVVARPPSGLPDLSVEFSSAGNIKSSGALQENDVFRASCAIRYSRPAANITWFLDGIQILEGLSYVAQEPPHCNEEGSLCSVMQNLTRSVSWKDNGKRLACVMDHFALEIGSQNQTIYQLNVQYKPRDDETSTEQFGFEIGKPGMIVKHVHANPRPTFQWNIGEGLWLNEGEHSGRFKADEAINNGHGAWYGTLHIDSLTASDVEKVFQLRTTNSVGSTDYQVSISTMDVPSGGTLGAGAVVGIVAAILIVLIIIFLVVFARTTGRWCFSASSSAKGKGSHSNSEAHIDPEISQPPKIEVAQEEVEGGMDNPANNDICNEYINDNDDIKKPLETDKDTQV